MAHNQRKSALFRGLIAFLICRSVQAKNADVVVQWGSLPARFRGLLQILHCLQLMTPYLEYNEQFDLLWSVLPRLAREYANGSEEIQRSFLERYAAANRSSLLITPISTTSRAEDILCERRVFELNSE